MGQSLARSGRSHPSLSRTDTSPRAIETVPAGTSGLSAVRRLRHRHLIDRLDYLRELRRLADGMSQSDIARALGLTQPSISSALKSAAKVADPPIGFSGASMYEIAQRFTAGDLDRAEVIDQLGRWQDNFARPALGRQPAGDELARALRDGLLDETVYRAVLDRRQRPDRSTNPMPTAVASGE